jgi:hypothetical protein
MNQYQKTIQIIRNRHNRIIAFSKKIQEAMGLSDEDAKWAFRNDVSWDIPGYEIVCSHDQCRNIFIARPDIKKIKIGHIYPIPTNNPPSRAKQKEILKIIKKNM